MKRVLVVAFDFPPRRTSGVYRSTGMAKYLPANGWYPTVLTPEKLDDEIEDPQLLARIPQSAEIMRTRYFPVAGWESYVSQAIQSAGGLQSPSSQACESNSDRKLRSMGALLRAILYYPDDTVGWVPFGLEAAVALHLRRRFDAIYTTSPPRSAPVIGLLFKWLFGLPWVAEFRDPWKPHSIPSRQKANCWILGALARSADRVVFHSRGFSEDMRLRYGLPQERVAVVSNGFDEPDFADELAPTHEIFPDGFIHLSHFGTIYQGRSGRFFEALAELAQESPELGNKLRVNIVGFPDDVSERAAKSEVLKEVIRFYPFMPHNLSIQAMRASHGLLLFWGDPFYAPLTVAGKLYEYLRTGRPILALDLGGETTEMIEAAEAGWAVQPDDTAAIKQAIRNLVAKAQAPPRVGPPQPEYVAQFRYDRLAAQLAGVLDEVAPDGC